MSDSALSPEAEKFKAVYFCGVNQRGPTVPAEVDALFPEIGGHPGEKLLQLHNLLKFRRSYAELPVLAVLSVRIASLSPPIAEDGSRLRGIASALIIRKPCRRFSMDGPFRDGSLSLRECSTNATDGPKSGARLKRD